MKTTKKYPKKESKLDAAVKKHRVGMGGMGFGKGKRGRRMLLLAAEKEDGA